MSVDVTAAIRRAPRWCAMAFCALALVATAPLSARATQIERLVTPGGIEVWVVRDATVPLVAIDFAFRGGANQDPADKAGVANMMAGLLDEGAGEYTDQAFHDLLERKAIELNVTAGRDSVRGTLRTLKENQDEAFNLLRLALNEPRFDAGAVERIRAQVVSRLQRQTTSPNDISSRTWWETAFPGHPYGRQVTGALDTVPLISADDLRTYRKRVLARDTLKVAVVGDIDIASVGRLIDRAFGPLPAKAELMPVPKATIQGLGRRTVVELDVPQAVMTFGGPGLARSDPDFMAGYVVNHVLGGGSFTSRLYREVREKRGLAYGVFDSMVWLNYAAVIVGGTATRSDVTREALDVIEGEFRNMAKDGPTQDELDKAKTYLKGSFALGLDTSTKIASQLVNMQLDELGIDYIERRPGLIDAVTLADAKRVAKRLLEPGMLVTVVGRPQGLTSKASGG
ncbi:MAG: zinc protease [Alphaproteobacteria bacterium]|nr:zinc protease [Alphaproteobacteria bacterium]